MQYSELRNFRQPQTALTLKNALKNQKFKIISCQKHLVIDKSNEFPSGFLTSTQSQTTAMNFWKLASAEPPKRETSTNSNWFTSVETVWNIYSSHQYLNRIVDTFRLVAQRIVIKPFRLWINHQRGFKKRNQGRITDLFRPVKGRQHDFITLSAPKCQQVPCFNPPTSEGNLTYMA